MASEPWITLPDCRMRPDRRAVAFKLGSGFRVLGLRVMGLGFRGLGFGVEGLGI